jgi:Transposase DDE domain group 1
VRLNVAGLRQAVKRDWRIEFGTEELTSYAGLELVRRYFERLRLRARVSQALASCGLKGDYASSQLVVLVITLLVVGARRLEQLGYIATDPLVRRISELSRIPSARTVRNWLRQFTHRSVEALRQLNWQLVVEQLERLGLRRITLDVDGTVVRTGSQAQWAFRGFNPHHRKDKSYYPLLAHVAQTGQILRLKNRPGNVHDSKGALDFLRQEIHALRQRFGRALVLECRMDAAFFQRGIIRLLRREGCEYAIKVPFCSWVGLRPLVAARKRWTSMDDHLSYFETTVRLDVWDMELRVMIYRKRVAHQTRKNFQLDLFSPDDGHYEYSAITTNKVVGGPALWHFAAGRGAQEKTIAELKGEFALDAVPSRDYGANSAWQQLSILAHNLLKGFQLDTLAPAKPRSPKRTALYLLQNMRTLRFELIARAARLCRPQGRRVLRLKANPRTQQLYEDVSAALAA